MPHVGVVSLVHVIRTFAHEASQPILHLRLLNPHAADACNTDSGRPTAIPRAMAASASLAGSRIAAAAGTSAFAFQGVLRNALPLVPAPTAGASWQ